MIARYRLAINRKQQTNGEQAADFISCIAFRKTAEFVEKYLHKGTKIAISGRIQTGSYTNKYGQKVYTTDVVVEEHEFCESKGSNSTKTELSKEMDNYDSMSFIEIEDESIPFQ